MGERSDRQWYAVRFQNRRILGVELGHRRKGGSSNTYFGSSSGGFDNWTFTMLDDGALGPALELATNHWCGILTQPVALRNIVQHWLRPHTNG